MFFTGIPCANGHLAARYVKRKQCVACARQGNAASYRRNHETRAAADAARYRAPGQAERMKAKVAEWGRRNRDRVLAIKARYREANAETLREKNRLYHAENPHIGGANSALRRARERDAAPPWVQAEDFTHIYDLARDLAFLTGVKYSVDHIIPLKHPLVCGLHVPWNLQVITHVENLKKANKFNPEDHS